MTAEPTGRMHTHRTPDVALWDHYRALREQWTHEDNLIAQRMGWLIWSEGLMFTAYGAHARDGVYWLVLGFPFFGILVAVLAGASGHRSARPASSNCCLMLSVAAIAV